ncbi:hemoglobin subunit alpha-3-like [Pelobates fuscus]|uniref:hemoglobin subunit alpha-3-like n=1 Tax=Pelobates fuscus TaxID=191477 RepID=UPI002FE4EFA2
MSTPPLALSDREKGALATFWVKITPDWTALGAAAMYRLILIHDDAREHYSQFDLSENSPDLRDHGVKIINAFGNAIKNMDNLPDAICDQNGLPMNVLHVETQHFWCMCMAIQITLVAHYKEDFTGECLSAWTKFIYHLSNALADKRK